MSVGGVRLDLRKLKEINQETGGKATAKQQNEPDVDTSKMSNYEREQYELVKLMKKIRENVAEREDPKFQTLKRTDQAVINNSIRKDVGELKKRTGELNGLSQKEGKAADYQQLRGHMDKTIKFAESKPSGGSGGPQAVSSSVRGSEMSNLGQNLMSTRDDEEFQAFFAQVREKDKKIDQLVDTIAEGVGRIRQNAMDIKQELAIQEKLLEEIEADTMRIQENLDNMNIKMKEILNKVKGESCCMYVMCLMLILAIGGGIYALVRA